MEYIYEVNISDIGKENCKKIVERLKKMKIFAIETDEKLIIKTDDFFFLTRFEKVIEAIKAGFKVRDAFKIITKDYDLYVVDLKDAAEKKKNELKRLLGLIIGEKGKVIKNVQKITKVKLRVKDRYVYILGDAFSVQAVFEGIRRLVRGTTISKFYDFIASYRKHLKNKEKEIGFYLKI